MICKKCGTEIGDSAFCFECGAKAEQGTDAFENVSETNAETVIEKPKDTAAAGISVSADKLPANMGNKKKIITAVIVCAVILTAAFVSYKPLKTASENKRAYNEANELYEQGMYTTAKTAFESLGDYKDSAQRAADCTTAMYQDKLDLAIDCYNKEDYITAITWFKDASSISDTAEVEEWFEKCYEGVYQYAINQYDSGNYSDANTYFGMISGYKDADEMASNALKEDIYVSAVENYNSGEYEGALELFNTITDYKDTGSYIDSCNKKILISGCKQAYINYLSQIRSYDGYTVTDESQYLLYDFDGNGIPELVLKEYAGPKGDMPSKYFSVLTYDESGSVNKLYEDEIDLFPLMSYSGKLYFRGLVLAVDDLVDIYEGSLNNNHFTMSVAYRDVFPSGSEEYLSESELENAHFWSDYGLDDYSYNKASDFSAIYNYG
ncbi:MAG: tetratricopeptide repeat protein [Clostridiales bacterium]|nr:tetratricopeptide repeat protein [Clostridiales bacterium]